MKALTFMLAIATLVLLAPSTWAKDDPYAHGGARSGSTMPPVHTFPGQGPNGKGPVGTSMGTVGGAAAKDHNSGVQGRKCRSQRTQGGSIPEC